MIDESCACCSTDAEQSANTDTERSAKTETNVDRWIDDSPVTEVTLPTDVQTTLGRFLGEESIETLGDWAAALKRQMGGSITVDDLCHANEPTGDWGVLDGEKYHFQCFYDAIALAELADSPVDIHTESPDGTVVEMEATGDGDIDVTPSGAVFSLGVDSSVEAPSDGGPTQKSVYVAVCPYVKAFPDRSAYESWAETAPAATVGMPLEDGIDFAAKLVQ